MSSVLIVDDEPNIRRMVGALLTAEGFDVREAPDGATGVRRVAESEPDAVLLDLMMPGEMDGMATLHKLRETAPDMPIVMMSGKAGLSDAVRATKLGAFNFLEKPLSPEGVLLALSSAIELRRARREAKALRAAAGLSGEMVGASQALHRVREMIARVAATDARVLITGESGTGKELVAAAIHEAGPRRGRPFVRVNCAAIPRDLLESEMFGHEKGAFTGASERRIGRFELAHTGTLFLDEVGDLGQEAQAKLLRAIEAKEIERVGGGAPIRVDVRILAATNKDLTRAVAEGNFREDLLFRLNVIPLDVPPLRERPDDIRPLVEHFSWLHASRTGHPAPRWADDAIALLTRYRWPGNVRELANVVERLAILHGGREVTTEEVRAVVAIGPSETGAAAPPLPDPSRLTEPLSDTLDAYERMLISRALSMAGGNVAEAARRLQTDRPNLYRRMRRLGIGNGSE
jgi:DNA-binding NtrC family response regulator